MSGGRTDGWETVPCVLCGADDKEAVYELADMLGDRTQVFRLVRCRSCGLRFIDPRPDRQAIGRFYPPAYDCYRTVVKGRVFAAKSRILRAAHGGSSSAPARLLAAGLFAALRDYFPGYPITRRQGTLLDVGCGAGHFLSLLHHSGLWRVTGLEPDRRMVDALCAGGLEVLHGQLERTGLGGRRFDVVRLWHVFEHLHDPRGGLERIGELLAPGGELVIGVPAIDSLIARLFGGSWWALDAPRHLYQFDRRTIVGLLESCGYRVLELRRIDAGTGFGSLERVWETAIERLTGGRRTAPRLFDRPLLVKLCRPLELPVNLLGLGDALVLHAVRDRQGSGDAGDPDDGAAHG